MTGINDANRIVGFYVDANGVQRGFYAYPDAAVPEPACVGFDQPWDWLASVGEEASQETLGCLAASSILSA